MTAEQGRLTVGADLGGTKLSMIVADDRGQVLREAWVPHRITGIDDMLATFSATAAALNLDELAKSGRVDGLGLSFAGWLDPARRRVVHSANLGIEDIDLHDRLVETFGLPVVIENDGDATLLGEAGLGAARGATDAMLLTLGTGVGGALLVNGQLVRGGNGFGGELGHMPVAQDAGLQCVCDNSGCLETVTSGRALAAITTQLRDSGASAWLAEQHPEGAVTARELGRAAAAGDPAALAALDTAAEYLARAVSTMIPITDPTVVVLGGSVIDGVGEIVLPAVRRHLASTAFLRSRREIVPVAPASLGSGAAALGAALAARA